MSREQFEQLKALGYVQGIPYGFKEDTRSAVSTSSATRRLRSIPKPTTTSANNAFVLVAQIRDRPSPSTSTPRRNSIVRRFLHDGQLPPKDAVRVKS